MSFSPLSSSLANSWFVSLAMTLKHALRHIYDVCRDKGKESRSWALGSAISKCHYKILNTVVIEGFVWIVRTEILRQQFKIDRFVNLCFCSPHRGAFQRYQKKYLHHGACFRKYPFSVETVIVFNCLHA